MKFRFLRTTGVPVGFAGLEPRVSERQPTRPHWFQRHFDAECLSRDDVPPASAYDCGSVEVRHETNGAS
jgi:hypothetical protein